MTATTVFDTGVRLIDSSVWIEWLSDTALGRSFADLFPDRSELLVPTIVQYDVSKWLIREISQDAANKFLSHTQLCVVVDLNTTIAASAAQLSATHRLAAAAAIVYATARDAGAELVTCDAHFQDLEHVTYRAKSDEPGAP